LATILLSLFAQLSIDIGPIPITGQTLAVLAIALLLKPRESISSIVLYLLLGSLGLPIFADGASGFAKLTGGSGGFLIGFLIAGGIVSYLFEKSNNKSFWNILGLTTLGTIIILICGNGRLISMYGLEDGLNYGFYPFWKGAIVKIFLGSGIVWLFLRKVKSMGFTLNSDT